MLQTMAALSIQAKSQKFSLHWMNFGKPRNFSLALLLSFTVCGKVLEGGNFGESSLIKQIWQIHCQVFIHFIVLKDINEEKFSVKFATTYFPRYGNVIFITWDATVFLDLHMESKNKNLDHFLTVLRHTIRSFIIHAY